MDDGTLTRLGISFGWDLSPEQAECREEALSLYGSLQEVAGKPDLTSHDRIVMNGYGAMLRANPYLRFSEAVRVDSAMERLR